jgi:hypothetical protein
MTRWHGMACAQCANFNVLARTAKHDKMECLCAMAMNGSSVIGKWPGVAPSQWQIKCLGATAANGRTQISWLWRDGSAMAQRKNRDRIRLPRRNGSGWPHARINNKISCLGAMAARESTIKLFGLGAISTRINIKIVSLGAMAAQESNH